MTQRDWTTEAGLTELERLSRAALDTAAAYHAIPIYSECGKYVNTSPEVSAAAFAQQDAEKEWERAIADGGHALLAALRAERAEVARLKKIVDDIPVPAFNDDCSLTEAGRRAIRAQFPDAKRLT